MSLIEPAVASFSRGSVSAFSVVSFSVVSVFGVSMPVLSVEVSDPSLSTTFKPNWLARASMVPVIVKDCFAILLGKERLDLDICTKASSKIAGTNMRRSKNKFSAKGKGDIEDIELGRCWIFIARAGR